MEVTLRAGSARAEIRPECGGTVDALFLVPEKGGEAVELLAGQPPKDRSGCEPGLFRGRLLAPFCDRIPGGRYEFRGKAYELPINDWENGDAIHGFLYEQPLEPSARSEGSLTLEHRSGDAFPGYPFSLELHARYELEPSRFRLSLAARNCSNVPAPVSLGWHPYFRLPGVQRVDELRLEVPAERYIAVNDRLLPTGELPPAAGTPWDFTSLREIGSSELDLGFPLEGSTVTLVGPSHSISLKLFGAFRYCQLFVPPDRRSIAIEPISGATNAFNRPELGLAVLEPGETISGECEISLG